MSLMIKIGFWALTAGAVVVFTLCKYYSQNRSSHYTTVQDEFPNISRDPVYFDGSSNEICCICLKEFETFSDRNKNVTLPCKHKYHRNCIKMVFINEVTGRRTCPLCRSLVSDLFISKAVMPETDI